jgi:hypothetical protein
VLYWHGNRRPSPSGLASLIEQSEREIRSPQQHQGNKTTPVLGHRRPAPKERTVKTTLEVKQAIANLIQSAIAGSSSSPFVEAAVSDDKLIVGARDQDGQKRFFQVCVEESAEVAAPSMAAPQSQPHDEAGEAAQATDGCCTGTQAESEATEASPVQEDTTEEQPTEPAEPGGETDTPAQL